MMAYIMSKFNFFFFVLATTGIFMFFGMNLANVMKMREAKNVLVRIVQNVKSFVESPSLCSYKTILIPKKISIFPDTSSLQDRAQVFAPTIFYKLRFDAVQIGDSNHLIISILDRKYIEGDIRTIVISAYDLEVPGGIWLYKEGNWVVGSSDTPQHVVLNPTGVSEEDAQGKSLEEEKIKRNAFVLVRWVKNGATTFYVYPCNIYSGSCEKIPNLDAPCISSNSNTSNSNSGGSS